MTPKAIKIAAWVGIAVNVLALWGMMADMDAEGTGYGILYALTMGVIFVVCLFGAHKWGDERDD